MRQQLHVVFRVVVLGRRHRHLRLAALSVRSVPAAPLTATFTVPAGSVSNTTV